MDNTETKKPAPIVVPADPDKREAVWQEVRGARLTLAGLRGDLREARRAKDWGEVDHLRSEIGKQVARLAEHEPVALAIHREEVRREN